MVCLQPALEASGYAYAVNATGGLPSGAVTAADLTRPRVDIVWVRNDDPSEGDASPNPTVVFGYTAGAPLASPVAPATPARCMVLATIQVPMSGGGAPTVIWVAPYTVAAGAPIPVWSQAERDALTLRDGLQVYRLDLHLTETYNGALTLWLGGAWTAYTPTLLGATTNPVFGTTGTSVGAYTRVGKTIHWRVTATAGGASINSGAGAYGIVPPVPALVLSGLLIVASGVLYNGTAFKPFMVDGAGGRIFLTSSGALMDGTNGLVTGVAGQAWTCTGTYEAA